MFVQDAGLLCSLLPRLQLGPRAHAFGIHRRRRGQWPAAVHRNFGRRRFAVHRGRPVRSRHAPQPQHAVPDRGQRRLRAHQGAVFRLRRHRQHRQARRGERTTGHRSLPSRDCFGLRLRGPRVFRRPRTAGAAVQGRTVASRVRDDRRDFTLRHVQRPRGLDQELPLYARECVSDRPHGLHSAGSRNQGRTRRGGGAAGPVAWRRQHPVTQTGPRVRRKRPECGPGLSEPPPGQWRGGHRPAVRGGRRRGHA